MDEDPSHRPKLEQGMRCSSRSAAFLALVAALCAAPRAALSQPDTRSQSLLLPPTTASAERRTREAIRLGLNYLRAAQNSRSGRVGQKFQVATTALAGLSVLGAGILPDQPPYDRFLRGCVSYLLESADLDGFINETDRGSVSDSESRMHGHCYAVLFLTQIVGSLPLETERNVRKAIERGVRVIERAQSREGGWWYTSNNRESKDEASVTVCAVQALRAARNTGFAVDKMTIDRGIDYVERCQTRNGSFRYSISEGKERSTFALTTAAVSTLNAAGVYKSSRLRKESEVLNRGLDYLRKNLSSYSRHPERAVEEQFFFYGNFYAAQALFQEGGTMWRNWYPKVRDNLLKPRAFIREGSRREDERARWRTTRGGESRYGNEYSTAMVLLVLEIPLGYLPIFQR